jgi:hypothetical protein
MGVVIEICVKHPGGPTRIRGADFEGAISIKTDGTRPKKKKAQTKKRETTKIPQVRSPRYCMGVGGMGAND